MIKIQKQYKVKIILKKVCEYFRLQFAKKLQLKR